MFEIPEFDRGKLKDKFYDMLYKYDGYCTKKEIAALLACEAESAAHLYAWKCSTRYADYVRDQSQKRKEHQPRIGRWIEHESQGIRYIECSECSVWFLRFHLIHNTFCPNCGAKMQKGEDKE